MTGALRIALLGAFPYPLAQGSQVYFEAQARALIRAGARCTLFTYGRGDAAPPDDLQVVSPPAFASPKRMRSGPSLAKPAADAALLATWVGAARRRHYDVVLAHNAEAAAIALAARGTTSVPVIYVVHTLLGDELSAYLPPFLSSILPSDWVDRADTTTSSVGARIDEAIARSADGFIALSEAARARLEPYTVAPLALLPPGLDPQPAPAQETIAAACHRHALEPGHFHLYSGNLDGYQEIDVLDAAARLLGADEPRIVLASHDATHLPEASTRWPALRCVAVRDFDEMRALMAGATSLLLPRKRVGGFPVKLVNYMEAARPIIARGAVADGLKDGESAHLLASDAGPEAWAEAMRRVDGDAEFAARIGRGARERLEHAHAWPDLVKRTLGLVSRVVAKRNL